MKAAPSGRRESIALVLGCDVVGSAVAHALHRLGWDVVLIDDIDPPGPWRGMSFVNAWYFGAAELLNVAACFCASVRSIPSVLHRQNLIAATSWSWQGVAAALLPDVLIDTRAVDGNAPHVLRGRAHEIVTVSCGSEGVAGTHADIVVHSGPGASSQTSVTMRAPRTGRVRTSYRVGERIEAGEPVADVNGSMLVAPVAGVLRGVSARGARVAAGQIVVDIDPRGDPAACYGLDDRATRAAADVIAALRGHGLLGTSPRPAGASIPEAIRA